MPRQAQVAAAAAAAAAPTNGCQCTPPLRTSSVHILWDLDNIPVAHAMHLPLIGRRLMQAVLRHAGGRQGAAPQPAAGSDVAVPHRPCQLTAYANERTLARLGGEAAARRALALVGGQLVAVPVRK
jgi:hypothetical protein